MADQDKVDFQASTTTESMAVSEELVDFPQGEFMNSLIQSFPVEWRGVFAPLNSGRLPVQAAAAWLENNLSSTNERLSNIPPNWSDFIDHLVKDCPVLLQSKLFFRPSLLLFPLNIQRNILVFVIHHSNFLTMEMLEKLVTRLNEFSAEIDGWRKFHLNILASKLRSLKRTENRDEEDNQKSVQKGIQQLLQCTDIISEESKRRFSELCEKTRVSESGWKVPWFSQYLVEESLANTEGAVKEEENSASFSAVETSSLTNKTNIIQEDTHMDDAGNDNHSSPCNNHTITGDLQVSCCDMDDNSDVEISDLTEVSEEQRPATTGMQLTVPPPPPGHFMIEMDIHAQSTVENEVSKGTNISRNFQTQITALENLLQSSDLREKDSCSELEVFSLCSTAEMESMCMHLNLRSIPESSVVSLCQMFVALSTEPSLGNAKIFASFCLLPKIQALQQAVSRILLTAISLFATRHPRAFCNGVIMKLISHSLNLGSPQVEVINKVIKDCLNGDARVHLLEQILAVKSDVDGQPCMWSENVVSVVQTIVDLKPELRRDLFSTFVVVLEHQSKPLSKSLKFGKMLLAVINKYCQNIPLHHSSFVRILEANSTFLKKAGLAALKKTPNTEGVLQMSQ